MYLTVKTAALSSWADRQVEEQRDAAIVRTAAKKEWRIIDLMRASRSLEVATGLDARHGAVTIAGHTLVVAVSLSLAVSWLRVAVDARHVGVVGVVDVAVGAYRRVMRQLPVLAVIESRVGPRSGVVAGGAGCREPGGNVIRHVAAQRDGTLPGSLMASVTIRRKIARIVAVDVAGGTRRCDMSASEGKARRGVVKLPG